MLNDKERKKFETIAKVHNGEVTRKEASIELNLTLKQIDRLKKFMQQREKLDLFMVIGVKQMLRKRMIV